MSLGGVHITATTTPSSPFAKRAGTQLQAPQADVRVAVPGEQDQLPAAVAARAAQQLLDDGDPLAIELRLDAVVFVNCRGKDARPGCVTELATFQVPGGRAVPHRVLMALTRWARGRGVAASTSHGGRSASCATRPRLLP